VDRADETLGTKYGEHNEKNRQENARGFLFQHEREGMGRCESTRAAAASERNL
jgi:hypothetical protein